MIVNEAKLDDIQKENLDGKLELTKDVVKKTQDSLFDAFSVDFFGKDGEVFNEMNKYCDKQEEKDFVSKEEKESRKQLSKIIKQSKDQFYTQPKKIFEELEKKENDEISDEGMRKLLEKNNYKSVVDDGNNGVSYINCGWYINNILKFAYTPKRLNLMRFVLEENKEGLEENKEQMKKLEKQATAIFQKLGEETVKINGYNVLKKISEYLFSLIKEGFDIFDNAKAYDKKVKEFDNYEITDEDNVSIKQIGYKVDKIKLRHANNKGNPNKSAEEYYGLLNQLENILKKYKDSDINNDEIDFENDDEVTEEFSKKTETIDDVTKKTAQSLVGLFNIDASLVNTGEIHEKYSDEVVSEQSREKYENRKYKIGKVRHNMTDRGRQKKLNKNYKKTTKSEGIQIYNEDDVVLQKKVSSTAGYARGTEQLGLGKNIYKKLGGLKPFESKELNDLAEEYYKKTKNEPDLIDSINNVFSSSTDPEIQRLKAEYSKQGVKEWEIGGNVVEQIVEQVDNKRKDISIFDGVVYGTIEDGKALKEKCKKDGDNIILPGFIQSYMQAKGTDTIDDINFDKLKETLTAAKSSSVCNQLAEGNNKFRVLISAYKTNKVKNLGAVEMKKGKNSLQYNIGKFFARTGLVGNVLMGVTLSSAIAFGFPAGVLATSVGMLGRRVLRNMTKKNYEHTKEVQDLYNKYVGEGNLDELKTQLQEYKDVIDGDIPKRKKSLSRVFSAGKYNEAKKKVSIISSVIEKSGGAENSLLKIDDLKISLSTNKTDTRNVAQVLALRDGQVKTGRQFISSNSIEEAEAQRLELQESYQNSVLNLVKLGKLGNNPDLVILSNKNHPLNKQLWAKYNDLIRKKTDYKAVYKDLVKGDKDWKQHFRQERRKEVLVKGGQTAATGIAMIGVSGALHGVYEHFRGDHGGGGGTNTHTETPLNHKDYDLYDNTNLNELGLNNPDGVYNFDLGKSSSGDLISDMNNLASHTNNGATVDFDNMHSGVSRQPAGHSFEIEMEKTQNELFEFINDNRTILSNDNDIKDVFSDENLDKRMKFAINKDADTGNAALLQTRKMEMVLEYLKTLNSVGVTDVKLDVDIDYTSDNISPSGKWANDDVFRNAFIGDVSINNPEIEIPINPVIPIENESGFNFAGLYFPIEKGTYGPATKTYLEKQKEIVEQKKGIFNRNKKEKTDEFSSSLSKKEVKELLDEITTGYCIQNFEKSGLKDKDGNKLPKGQFVIIGVGKVAGKKIFRTVGEDGKEYFIKYSDLGNGIYKNKVGLTVGNKKLAESRKKKLDKEQQLKNLKEKIEKRKNDGEVYIDLKKDIKLKNGEEIKQENGPYILKWDESKDRFELYNISDNGEIEGEKLMQFKEESLIKAIEKGYLDEKEFTNDDINNIDERIINIDEEIGKEGVTDDEKIKLKKEKEDLEKIKKNIEEKIKKQEDEKKTSEKEFFDEDDEDGGGTGKTKKGKKGGKDMGFIRKGLNTVFNKKAYGIQGKRMTERWKKMGIENKNYKKEQLLELKGKLIEKQNNVIEEIKKQQKLIEKDYVNDLKIEENKNKQNNENNKKAKIDKKYYEDLEKLYQLNVEEQESFNEAIVELNEQIKKTQEAKESNDKKENENKQLKTIQEEITKANGEFNEQTKKLNEKMIKSLKTETVKALVKLNKIKLDDLEKKGKFEKMKMKKEVIGEAIEKRKASIESLNNKLGELETKLENINFDGTESKGVENKMKKIKDEIDKKQKKIEEIAGWKAIDKGKMKWKSLLSFLKIKQ